MDAVEFGFTAHRGTQDADSVLPLNKSASGGELSRVMLALEVVLAEEALELRYKAAMEQEEVPAAVVAIMVAAVAELTQMVDMEVVAAVDTLIHQ